MVMARVVLSGTSLAVLAVPASFSVSAPTETTGTPKSMTCAGNAYRQFDFWVGDWDVVDIERPTAVVAHAKVEKILNGCVLHEIYEDADGHKGQSFSIYDVTRNTRHQSWVTDRGQLLTIEGHLHGEEMILEGTDHLADRRARQVRGRWRIEGALRQWFLAIVVVSMSTSVLADEALDQIAISELDLRFQAAVKHNDAATMAEILHEDMILVVGDGRTFTREEQLRDAKQKLILYDIQDEEPGTQTVRVHGDIGIVTALLHIKGSRNGLPIERRLWFSDTYVRTSTGWKYLFGQASLALPPNV